MYLDHEIPDKLWETLGEDIITVNEKHYLCIVDYHNKFPVIKHITAFNADNLIKT